jgi:FimV-like protein
MSRAKNIPSRLILPKGGSYLLALLLAATCIFPSNALALGVLEPQLKSYINERLEIEIPLKLTEGEKDADIYIRQVPGRERNISEWVPELSFNLVNDGKDNFSVIARTRDLVIEPIVHFTLSIKTRDNWIQKEMSFLMDPRPVAALARSRAKETDEVVVLKPSEAKPRSSAKPSYPERPAIPTAAPIAADTGSYMVKSGDSLSLIERKFRGARNATAQQAMVSIFNANQHAFINNDINKIKAHVEIVIPDDAEMKKLSTAEARQIFNMLLTGEEPSPQPTVAAPAPAPEPAVMPAEAPAEITAPAPAPEPVMTEAAESPAEVTAKTEKDFELTLTPDDEGVPETAIKQNEGTIVYETPESVAEKAALPSPDMRENIQSAVSEMEEQLTTLREEIKRLQKTLQDKEKQQAATAATIQQTTEEIASQDAGQATDTGPVEIETSSVQQADSDFDYLRLLIEILTLGAAGGFIGYFIALRRKRREEDIDSDERVRTGSYTRPVFSSGSGRSEKAEPGDKASTYAPTPPENTAIGPDGIEVADANIDEYDESIRAAEAGTEDDSDEPGSEDETQVNPEYILQEANLSIAFSDLDNAYHLLMKLINHEPRNPEYRILIMGVLKDLLKEGEFLFHANHLADITGRSADNEWWEKGVELGQAFTPEHELFVIDDHADEITDVNPVLQDAELPGPAESEQPAPVDMHTTNTSVLDSRKALAEHERMMREKEGSLEEYHEPVAHKPKDSGPEPLSFEELLDNDEAPSQAVPEDESDASTGSGDSGLAFEIDEQATEDAQDSAPGALSFDELLDNDEAPSQAVPEDESDASMGSGDSGLAFEIDEQAAEGAQDSGSEPLSFDELLDNDEKPAQSSQKDDDNVLEYDSDPFAARSGPEPTQSAATGKKENSQDLYHDLEDQLDPGSLVSKKTPSSDEKNADDEDDDSDKTILTKRDD